MSDLDRDIDRLTDRLVKESREIGVYENFGGKEVIELVEKYLDDNDFSEEMNKKREKIIIFAEWCKKMYLIH